MSAGKVDDVVKAVRDTLIVAANNPVAHGGIRHLPDLMRTQANRLEAALLAAAQQAGDAVALYVNVHGGTISPSDYSEVVKKYLWTPLYYAAPPTLSAVELEAMDRLEGAGYVHPDDVDNVCAALRRTAQSDVAVDAKYAELIYAVGNKYPGESRHETALRYIRQAEQSSGEAQAALSSAAAGEGDGK